MCDLGTALDDALSAFVIVDLSVGSDSYSMAVKGRNQYVICIEQSGKSGILLATELPFCSLRSCGGGTGGAE